MDSLQDIASGSHPRRSPRILELARLQELEKDKEAQSQQRDAHLQQRRLLYKLKKDSMTEVEREALLEKQRSAYRNRKSRITCGQTAETRELRTATQFRKQDPEVGTSTTTTLQLSNLDGEHNAESSNANEHFKERIVSQDNVVVSGSTTFGPRRSPRIIEQIKRRELVDTQEEKGKKRCIESVEPDNENVNKKLRLERRRIADMVRRSSMIATERDQILEKRRTTYHIQRTRLGDVPESDLREGTISGIGTGSGRSKKRQSEVDVLLEHHAEGREKRVRFGSNNGQGGSHAIQLPLRRSPRLSPHPQHREPSHLQNAIGTLIGRAKKRKYEIDEELTTNENKGSKKCHHENNPEQREHQFQERHVLVKANTTRLGTKNREDPETQTSTDRSEAPTFNLHKTPRLIEQAQCQESSDPSNQNSNINRSSTDHAVDQVPPRTQEINPTIKAIQAIQLPLRRSPRLSPHPQHREPTHTQNVIGNETVIRRSPQFIGQFQLQDKEAAEASRKKKGKAVMTYQKRRRASSYVPEINPVGPVVIGDNNNNRSIDDSDSSSDDEPRPNTTTGASTSTTYTSQTDRGANLRQPSSVIAANVIPRRSPRLRDLAQNQQSSREPTEITLRKSPRITGRVQQANAQNLNATSQGVQVARGRGRPPRSIVGRSSFLNCARGTIYKVGFQKFHLPPSRTCSKCQALIFYREPKGFCCSDGKVVLPFVPPPVEILELFDDQTEVGIHFRRYIRRYNQCFCLTSIGVNYDRELADNREGVYTFRVQGDIYHRIGSLLPPVVENETDPPTTVRPRYVQMYIYDTDNEIDWRMEEGGKDLNREVMEKLRIILDTHNRFVHVIRPLAQREDIQRCKLVIKEQPATEKQYTLPTASQVAAIVVEGDDSEKPGARDIVVRTTEGKLLFINETSGCYDPLQYPLLLPYGSYGWDLNSMDENGRKCTCLEYYSYMLQIRRNDASLLLRGGRLLQQYAVDNWVKIDSSKLRWLANHQEEIRAELHQGLQDARTAGETSGKNFGQRVVLPSSYMGSPRDMYQRYQDAMALVQKYGKPDLFITMTCNPLWEEIVSNLEPGQSASDRPDLATRAFRARLEELKEDLFTKSIFGRVAAHVHVVEFQKRGLPHVHMLIILRDEDKLQGPDDYDKIVRAEIPDPEEEPELHECVKKWMIHGPCGSKCMRDGKCKRNFPKEFSECTVQGKDAYPVYRRRNNGLRIHKSDHYVVDNRMVVPYNPWLLQKYDCHINVEICSSVESVKYLYKYVYKGPDYVSFGVQPVDHDEIQRYINARWVCAQEAMWKIFSFPLYKVYPSVVRLQIHLPNQQSVRYYDFQTLDEILSDERNLRTTLTEFFVTNARDPRARELLYREFPEYYCWDKTTKEWRWRRSTQKAIGRVYTVPSCAGEVWFLRHILNHVRGPTSFDDLLCVDGERCRTFKRAAEKMGLLENDQSARASLAEAATVKMPYALRRQFASILHFCNPTGVRELWDEFFNSMVEDYSSSSNTSSTFLSDRLLRELNLILKQHDKDISMYDLPPIVGTLGEEVEISSLIQEELSIPISDEDLSSVQKLNEDQSRAYNIIMGAIERKESKIFFIDGPGGTGKTYLYRAILATVRKNGGIALATATSGIAATMLPGGRTAHSRFQLPMTPTSTSWCRTKKQTEEAKLLRHATVLMWDEATMAHRYSLEAFDRTMRDITGIDESFGGKILIMGGDFRQVLPVIPRSTRGQTVDACLSRSHLWKNVHVLHLKKNMRAAGDASYSKFLIRVGDGDEPCIANEMIKVPEEMVIPWVSDASLSQLIDVTFPNLVENARDIDYMVNRALITPLNEYVEKLNDRVLSIFPGKEVLFYSFDSVDDDTHGIYQQEYLNNIAPGGLPSHILKLKIGAPIMLLRNVDAKNGLCNGTRLIIKEFFPNCIDAVIISGNYIGTRVFIHRMPLEPPENLKLPYKFKRKQFPIRLCFAFTVNKAQGQTIENTGIFFPEHVFSHGQLYVALSRGVSSSNTKVLVAKGTIPKKTGTYTKNVVYKEVFLS